MPEVEFRRFELGTDDVARLTRLLHACYASLLEQGLRFTATHQTDATTRRRLQGGRCWLAGSGGEWVGTVTWYEPRPYHDVAHYRDPAVAYFGMLGVLPSFRGQGLGRRLVELAEAEAREHGYRAMALDTSEDAPGLVKLYESWGYAVIGQHDWRPGVNYASLVLSKPLA
ncbi:MAG: GNAT family N-acetyltransferase [Fimbriimonadaceae bacterium]|nr:GNAT family N-acetyltransferase [Fimbriimonadaceae bacterium]QYK55013.1 MAG: GNAT family N-acetyltransferase [Fimbriimonadaceae bacterium]